jgi:hypothetical protein
MKYMNADEIKTLINEALSYGYHVAKDEAKGIRSYGYASIFFARHDIKQKLQQHGVMQGLLSDCCQAKITTTEIHYCEECECSCSPTVGKAGGDASVSDGK